MRRLSFLVLVSLLFIPIVFACPENQSVFVVNNKPECFPCNSSTSKIVLNNGSVYCYEYCSNKDFVIKDEKCIPENKYVYKANGIIDTISIYGETIYPENKNLGTFIIWLITFLAVYLVYKILYR